MRCETVLAEAVAAWASRQDLPDRAPIAAAQALAIAMYRDGADVGEARARAESFLRSWASHPSNGPAAVTRPTHLRAVS